MFIEDIDIITNCGDACNQRALKKSQIVIDFNVSMLDEDIPENVDVFFTSENNPYGVLSLKWTDGNELAFALKPRKNYFYYTDLTIRQYKFTKKQKSTGQRSCSKKSTIECTTFG